MRATVLVMSLASTLVACSGWGSGSKWVQQPLDEDKKPAGLLDGEGESAPNEPRGRPGPGTRTLGKPHAKQSGDPTGGGGRVLGKFRNTYYDFPREADHSGPTTPLMNAQCQPIAQVPRAFHDSICVQGSGSLKRGGTVSFAKRDCACAEICPRTNQKICFEALDATKFPWGRGAMGTPITPMRTLAADGAILPMGTVVYIPELDGAPRGEAGEPLDGCFVVEDRGLKVKGEHVDIFTGNQAHTAVLEQEVPSNQGVTVVLQAPRCAHLAPR